MGEWKRVKIGQFLKERGGRYDPGDDTIQGLKRLNKIDFSGEIHLSDKWSKTDMIVVEPGDLVISGINVSKGAIAVYHGEDAITAKGGIGNIKLLIKIHKCGVQEVIDATYCLYFFLLASILNFWSNQSSTDS